YGVLDMGEASEPLKAFLDPLRLKDNPSARRACLRLRMRRSLPKPGEHGEVLMRLRGAVRGRHCLVLLAITRHRGTAPSPCLDQAARLQNHHEDKAEPEKEPPPQREVHLLQRIDSKRAAKGM